jgi:dTDP-4-amino-4,6-dideoxygalactose transaminase
MARVRIPFNKPFVAGKELQYIAEAISGGDIAGDGRFTIECARLLEERFRIRRVLMTPSCTSALEMAAILSGLQSGDEVIMPSFTFVSTANAVMRLGARPVFVDIRQDTLNIDETRIESAITPRTRAVYVVHYAGVGCEMDDVLALARKYNLFVLEDAAQGVNAFYKGRVLGSIGHLGAYSFHHTKNYICGEGGALCVNEADLIERAEIIREKGTNRSQFFRGEVDKYTWVDVGSSYVPGEIGCAFLYAQLETMDSITARRRQVYDYYVNALRSAEERELLQRPVIPEGCTSNYHSFHVILPSAELRDEAMKYLKQRGIQAVFHYIPLHTSPMGLSVGNRVGDLPITESVAARLLRLPFYNDISEIEQQEVVGQLTSFLESGT